MKNLLIPVEIFTRSFKSRFRIGYHFALAGGTSLIGPRATIRNTAETGPKRLNYLSKGEPADENTREFLTKFKEDGSRIFLLDEEGGILDRNAAVLKFRYASGTVSLCEKVFLWGPAQLEPARNLNPDYRGFVVTGNPRFDCLQFKIPWETASDLNEFIARHGCAILVNSSWPLGNSFRTIDENVRMLLGLQSSKDLAFSAGQIEMMCSHHRLVYLYFKDMLRRLVGDLGDDVGLIIRPHPSENPAAYQVFAAEYSNVIVDHDRRIDAGQLSSHCKLTVHYDCTTGIEAMIAKAAVISYKPFVTEFTQPLPLESSPQFESYDVLLQEIKRHLAGRGEKTVPGASQTQKIQNCICNAFREVDTAKEIADTLYENAVDGRDQPVVPIEQPVYRPTFRSRARGWLKGRVRSDEGREYRANKEGSVDRASVEAYLGELNTHYGQNVAMRSFPAGCYQLSQ